MRVICEGCGQPLPIPDGYRRNKIQCGCGVICSVPEAARREAASPERSLGALTQPRSPAKPARAVEEQAERWLLDDDPPASAPPSEPPNFQDPEPEQRPEAAAAPAAVEKRFRCRRCGELVRRQRECPKCDPAAKPTGDGSDPVWWPSVDEPEQRHEEEEDDSPYGVDGEDEVQCPKCCLMLPPGSVLCVRCGFHLKKRKKVGKTYQPIERQWETNWSLQGRRTAWAALEVLALALGLLGVFWGGADLGVFIGSFLGFTAMMAFLLGTFDRIHLMRDARGRVRLTKTWRLCFFERQPLRIDVRGFEGIVSGRHHDVTAWEYFLFFFLLVSGIIPGLIWFYLAIYKVTFHVSLCRDHGFPEQILYSGWNEMQMKEIAFALRDASGLPYDEG